MGINTARQLPAAAHVLQQHTPRPAHRLAAEQSAPPKLQLQPRAAAERLLSLDVFRGITVVGMLLVNNPGTARFGYRVLQHAEWNGCQPPDLIFPFFLFIVGVAIVYSLAKQESRHVPRRAIIIKIARRSATIFGIGMLLNALPYFDWEITRIPGVLQRIALCYCTASLVVVYAGVRGQALTAAVLLAVYWVLMLWVPVPGYGAGALQPDANLAAYVDRALMSGHLWRHHWDPEGLLSSAPAVSTTLIGVLAGHWLRSPRDGSQRVIGLLLGGAVGIALGGVMNIWFPINKSLWTSSYVMFTGGAALVGLGLCYWLVDLKGYRRWATPFVIFGTNAIAAYALSTLMTKALALWTVTRGDGMRVMLKTHLFEVYFLPLATRRQASILYALAFVGLWLALMSILYRKHIFIKI